MVQLKPDDDAFIGNEDRLISEQLIAANDAFVALMAKQIRKGREHVKAGVVVDTTAGTTKRFYPEPTFSSAGSPAAMCAEKGDGDPKDLTSYV